MSQEVRSDMGTLLLKLTIKELFEWRFMQTDPNWGNFLYDEASGGRTACCTCWRTTTGMLQVIALILDCAWRGAGKTCLWPSLGHRRACSGALRWCLPNASALTGVLPPADRLSQLTCCCPSMLPGSATSSVSKGLP